jgi:hypothetical protein
MKSTEALLTPSLVTVQWAADALLRVKVTGLPDPPPLALTS